MGKIRIEELKKWLQSYRQAIWIARYLILGFITFGLYEKINLYLNKELDLLHFLFEITMALICALIPFAYGIKEEEPESD
ncbi:hypothetical protein FZC66_15040 [Priestia megaterium]|nr:hypothetical protein FZC66_15040 [Priestia megaterium]